MIARVHSVPMLLAEALNRRAQIGRDMALLLSRITQNAMYQEGDGGPPDDPAPLVVQLRELHSELQELMARINMTNSSTLESTGTWTITWLLARRDQLRSWGKQLQTIAQASGTPQHRYGRDEIRKYAALPVPAMYQELEDVKAVLREVESQLQKLNWSTELR